MEARTDAIQRTSQTGREQRSGGANRWEWARSVANRELPGVSHGTTQCLLCLTGTPGHGHTVLGQPAEPPYADPHVRWCGRGGRATVSPIPIWERVVTETISAGPGHRELRSRAPGWEAR